MWLAGKLPSAVIGGRGGSSIDDEDKADSEGGSEPTGSEVVSNSTNQGLGLDGEGVNDGRVAVIGRETDRSKNVVVGVKDKARVDFVRLLRRTARMAVNGPDLWKGLEGTERCVLSGLDWPEAPMLTSFLNNVKVLKELLVELNGGNLSEVGVTRTQLRDWERRVEELELLLNRARAPVLSETSGAGSTTAMLGDNAVAARAAAEAHARQAARVELLSKEHPSESHHGGSGGDQGTGIEITGDDEHSDEDAWLDDGDGSDVDVEIDDGGEAARRRALFDHLELAPRARGGTAGVGGGESLDQAIESERKVQEALSEDMLELAGALKAYALEQQRIVAKDVDVLDKTGELASTTQARLDAENKTLEQQLSSSWRSMCMMWGLLALSVLIFLATYMVIKWIPKRVHDISE